jgi:hypothetical protein
MNYEEMWKQLHKALKLKSLQAEKSADEAKSVEAMTFCEGMAQGYDSAVNLMNVMKYAAMANDSVGND